MYKTEYPKFDLSRKAKEVKDVKEVFDGCAETMDIRCFKLS